MGVRVRACEIWGAHHLLDQVVRLLHLPLRDLGRCGEIWGDARAPSSRPGCTPPPSAPASGTTRPSARTRLPHGSPTPPDQSRRVSYHRVHYLPIYLSTYLPIPSHLSPGSPTPPDQSRRVSYHRVHYLPIHLSTYPIPSLPPSPHLRLLQQLETQLHHRLRLSLSPSISPLSIYRSTSGCSSSSKHNFTIASGSVFTILRAPTKPSTWAMRAWGDGEMGRWGDGEMGRRRRRSPPRGRCAPE